ncbi:MAG: crotonase/enoyl-CoA hydratase family protein [Bacteroidetes bacterium]|nr:MAG: crotonase/enoyl-CoA hydratase family protein [Bacteroidota bacterium]
MMNWETFLVDVSDHVALVRINRPDKSNALNRVAWQELKAIFTSLDENEEVRAIVLSGEGKHFSSGIDLSLLMEVGQMTGKGDEGRNRERLRRVILDLQATINAIEVCRKPVLAAIHGACIGGAVDIVAACDMRYCSAEAYFTVKEIDMGMVADLGSLQRLPRIISEGMAREMAFTGRKVGAEEALRIGLVNRVSPDSESLRTDVMDIARSIAAKSPLSTRGIKEMMNYARDHSVADGLNYIATWNAAMLVSEDLMTAFQASMSKQEPKFKN